MEYISIIACEICLKIEHKKDLPSDETMTCIDGLTYKFSESYNSGRYCNHTDLLLCCSNCATYYSQYHSIDTEDAFVGGPSVVQNIQRVNLVRLKEMLQTLARKEDLDAFSLKYPIQIDDYISQISDKAESLPLNILPHLIESLTDYFIINNNWGDLHELLLCNVYHQICVDTLYDLIIMSALSDSGGIFPSFTYYKNISPEFQKTYLPFFLKHKRDILITIERFKNSEIPAIRNKYNLIINAVKYYKIED